MAKFGCERTYPKKLYDRVVKHGTVESNWSGGRPAEFSPRCWEAMITIIRLHRTKHRVASSRNVSADLKKVPGRKRKKAPSARHRLAREEDAALQEAQGAHQAEAQHAPVGDTCGDGQGAHDE
eukprot:scaffold57937_cov60-Phaeocystis_antarctica.AAC.2